MKHLVHGEMWSQQGCTDYDHVFNLLDGILSQTNIVAVGVTIDSIWYFHWKCSGEQPLSYTLFFFSGEPSLYKERPQGQDFAG